MFTLKNKAEMGHFSTHEYGHLQNPAELSKTLVLFFNSDTVNESE